MAREIESSFPVTATQHIGSKYVTSLLSRTTVNGRGTTGVEPQHAHTRLTCIDAPGRRVGLAKYGEKFSRPRTYRTDGSTQVDLKLISLHVPVFQIDELHPCEALQHNMACRPQLLPASRFTSSVPGSSLTSLLIHCFGCDNLPQLDLLLELNMSFLSDSTLRWLRLYPPGHLYLRSCP